MSTNRHNVSAAHQICYKSHQKNTKSTAQQATKQKISKEHIRQSIKHTEQIIK